jgi:hypothetical protein
MWSGEYDEAIAGFRRYLESEEQSQSHWVLSAAFARMVRDVVGGGKQQRDRKAALQLATPIDGGFEDSQFEAAVRADGLCSLAWFNKGIFEVNRGNHSDAAKCFCAAALCQRGDIDAWRSAVISALSCGQWAFFLHLATAAYQSCGEDFCRALFALIRSQGDEFPRDLVINKLGEILASLPATGTTTFTMRLHSSVTK